MLVEQGFVMTDASEKVALGEPAASLAWDKGSRDTRGAPAGAVPTRELAVTLDLALLAQLASQYTLRLPRNAVRLRCGPVVHRYVPML